MMAPATIFLDVNLPNATTWFFFSGLLAVGFFCKFSRIFSVRNLDVVALFLLVPALLLLQEARSGPTTGEKERLAELASVIGNNQIQVGLPPLAGLNHLVVLDRPQPTWTSARLRWLGYLWLLCGSAYFFMRCLIDLALVQRPALAPNLNFGGLAWLAGALFISLATVAYRPPDNPSLQTASNNHLEPATRGSKMLELVQEPFEGMFYVKRTLAVVCHLLVVVGLIMVGVVHFQDPSAGMGAATFYLLIPYTGFQVGQVDHVWPMAVIIWAVAAYRHPLLAGAILGLATGTMFFPALILPVWLSFFWKRGVGRFLVAFLFTAGLCLFVTWMVLWWRNEDPAGTVREALSLATWQAWKIPTTESFWTGVHWSYRIPVFIAYCAFVLTTACWPVPKNLGHVLALSAAILIGLQFWYADQGGVFILWYLPLLLLLVFRPNLSERRPEPLQADRDWLSRCRRRLARLFTRPSRQPEPIRH